MLHTPTIHTQILQTYIDTHTYYIICILHSHTYIAYVHTYHHIHKHGHTHYNGHMVITYINKLWSGGVLILFIL